MGSLGKANTLASENSLPQLRLRGLDLTRQVAPGTSFPLSVPIDGAWPDRFPFEGDPKGHPQLNYVIATDALDRIAETHLGKTILISNRLEWTDERIIEAYRSQFLIEAVFRKMKDRTTGSWWPLNHRTDSKLRVHGLYSVWPNFCGQ